MGNGSVDRGGLIFPARKADKGFMEKVIPELELEGQGGFPKAEMGWCGSLQFPL